MRVLLETRMRGKERLILYNAYLTQFKDRFKEPIQNSNQFSRKIPKDVSPPSPLCSFQLLQQCCEYLSDKDKAMPNFGLYKPPSVKYVEE